MKNLAFAIFILGALHRPAPGQVSFPVQAGPFIQFLPPAISADGRTVAFGSTVSADGKVQDHIDIYSGSKGYPANIAELGVTADGAFAIFIDVSGGTDNIVIIDTSSGAIRKIATDSKGCARPLIFCLNCSYSCIATLHSELSLGIAIRRLCAYGSRCR